MSMNRLREAATGICLILTEAGHRALFAGGCVRDLLLGRSPQDYDIATSARPDEVAALFPKTVDVGAAFGVQVVVLPEGAFEVATFRKDGPYLDGRRPRSVAFVDEREDAFRRDFTINAMFFDPASEAVVDYVGGRTDLDAGVIRAVGDAGKRFDEDHLRLLRAVRFAARLDYVIADETMAAIRSRASSIVHTAAERVRDELLKLLTEGGARRAFELMDETGLLEHVLPEVARMKGVAQPDEFHPEGDVFIHTLLMLEAMHDPSYALAMAVLLHDVGKPLTQTFDDRIRFNNHDKVGAREAEKVCRRVRMPAEATARIAWLVENHMRVAAAPKMRPSTLKRMLREEAFPELLELFHLDCMASHRDIEAVEWLKHYAERVEPDELKPPPLLTGNDLLAMGYEPGPLFSTILSAVEDAQLNGALTSAGEARSFARCHWPPPAQ